MQIKEISKLNQPTEQKPLTIWENSVHATHKFLNNDEILQIRNYVPQAVGFYEHLVFKVVKRSETDDQGNPYPILKMKLFN